MWTVALPQNLAPVHMQPRFANSSVSPSGAERMNVVPDSDLFTYGELQGKIAWALKTTTYFGLWSQTPPASPPSSYAQFLPPLPRCMQKLEDLNVLIPCVVSSKASGSSLCSHFCTNLSTVSTLLSIHALLPPSPCSSVDFLMIFS